MPPPSNPLPARAPEDDAASTSRLEARRRLLEAVADSIREKGLQRTQINDIVRLAQVSKRTFYECFPDKESCFVELIEQWSDELFAAVERALDPEGPWEAQVDACLDAYLAALNRDRAFNVFVTRELASLGSRGAHLEARDVDRFVTFLMEMTRDRGMRRAGVEPVTRDTAVMLIGGISELVDRATRDGRPPESTAETIKAVVKLVLRPR
jgi:AcrR family transcriptional regulator